MLFAEQGTQPTQVLDTTSQVDTPERVRFRFRLAGPGPRAVAWLIDFAVRGVVLVGVAFIVIALASVDTLSGLGEGLILLTLFALGWLYGAFFETLLSGQTPGKVLVGIRVVKTDGAPGRFPDFLLRNLLTGVDFLPIGFGVGVAVMAIDPMMRRVGDLVAGTVVVLDARTRVLSEVEVQPPVTEDERVGLPARVDLNREEIAVIEAFLRRRRLLSDERSEELSALLAPQIRETTGVEAGTCERVLALAYARATHKDRLP